MAVVGFRYGSIVPGEMVSYTELEFDEAGTARLPRLVFLWDETVDLPAGVSDADRAAVEGCRQRLRGAGLVVRTFTSDTDLELEVFHALTELYVNLRGFDPSGSPMTPAEAVRGFLDAFEVPAQRIPVSVDAQTALYRSLLAGRKVLVVLDNARDVDQVRPLLPSSPGCLAVVTSRNRLAGLIAAEGAHPLT